MDIFSGENLINLIKAGGLIGLFLIIFSESGLLVGFFLPGDSLLFTAGFLSSQGYFNLALLILISFAGAVIGDSVGYTFGHKVGPRIFNRTDSLLFKKENLVKAQNFYRKYGGKTIILARFTPIIRTFAPIVAGAGEMKYRDFIIYNLTGGLLWTLTMCLGGYFLGSVIPNVDKYMLPIIAVIIFISLLPTISEVIKSLRNKKAGTNPAKPVI